MENRDTDVLAHIGGEWITTGNWRDNINPADTREVIGRSVECGIVETKAAIAAAKAAFASWRKVPAPVRGDIVAKAGRLMVERSEALALALSREEGKTLIEARGEVQKSIRILEFLSGEGRRNGGDVIPSEMVDTFCYTTRQPLGVVSLITPWNFPVAIPTWKIAPALIAGNTVVFKPASLTPLTGRMVTEIYLDAGIPHGVLNFVTGPGSTVGEEMIRNPDIAAISFTGSNEVGMKLSATAAELHKKCQCEMGGKNPLVVLADADIDQAVSAAIKGAFGSTGQRCTATSRVIVERPVYDSFVAKITEAAKAVRVGDPLSDKIQMGPSVDANQFGEVHKYIAIGKEEGATLCTGGEKITSGDLQHGFFTEPTIFTDVKPDMRIAQEEIFGPVLAIIPVDSFEEAIDVANGVQYGLSASIYTRDLAKTQRFVEMIEVGITHVNAPTVGGEAQLPFGGTKATGVGDREMGTTAIQFFSELKTVYINYATQKSETNLY